MSNIGLAEAIEQLRSELGAAQDAGADQQLRFSIEEIEVELLLELKKDGKASAKAQFGVVTIGAEGGLTSSNTHRVKLRLKVTDAARGGEPAEIER